MKVIHSVPQHGGTWAADQLPRGVLQVHGHVAFAPHSYNIFGAGNYYLRLPIFAGSYWLLKAPL
jgi:hypothetical protein